MFLWKKHVCWKVDKTSKLMVMCRSQSPFVTEKAQNNNPANNVCECGLSISLLLLTLMHFSTRSSSTTLSFDTKCCYCFAKPAKAARQSDSHSLFPKLLQKLFLDRAKTVSRSRSDFFIPARKNTKDEVPLKSDIFRLVWWAPGTVKNVVLALAVKRIGSPFCSSQEGAMEAKHLADFSPFVSVLSSYVTQWRFFSSETKSLGKTFQSWRRVNNWFLEAKVPHEYEKNPDFAQ